MSDNLGPSAPVQDERQNEEWRHKKSVAEDVGRKAQRRMRADRQRDRGLWFGLGMFGLVGWSVAVPALLGVLAGLWLDGVTEGQVSWTLTLLILGVALGCLNAWYWVRRESRHDE